MEWLEDVDRFDNTMWVALSPYVYDEAGDPMMWRLKCRLRENRREWYEAHDAELLGRRRRSWVSLHEAKREIEMEDKIIRAAVLSDAARSGSVPS